MAFSYKAYKESQNVSNARKKKEETESPYKQSAAVNTALADYNTAKATAPKEVNVNNFTYANQLKNITNDILNRKPFQYDLNADMLYQQYKDQYINGGRLAMADTMGQAQAATGGYGNSYAQSVGQQTYQGYLNQLNERIPELYNLAMQKYQLEGDDLNTKYGLLSDRYGTEYGEYRDRVGDYNTSVDRAYDRYNTERNFDYGRYADDRSYYAANYSDEYNRDYGRYGDDYGRSFNEYQQGVAEQQNAQDLALQYAKLQEDQRQFNAQMALKGSGSTGSGNGGSTSSNITEKLLNDALEAYGQGTTPEAKEKAVNSIISKYQATGNGLTEDDINAIIDYVLEYGDDALMHQNTIKNAGKSVADSFKKVFGK